MAPHDMSDDESFADSRCHSSKSSSSCLDDSSAIWRSRMMEDELSVGVQLPLSSSSSLANGASSARE